MTQHDSAGLAWITGGGTGIGRALALLLADKGWRVVISGRRQAPLDETAASAGGSIIPLPCDVTDLDAVRTCVKDIETEHGALDWAILNAGVYEPPAKGRTFSAEQVRKTNEVNYMGVVHCIDAVLPAMQSRGAGHIAIVASLAGYTGLPMSGAYGASKAALINLAESLKFDLESSGVGISVVNPGFIKTPLTDKNDFPMPLLADADDMARAIYKGLQHGDFEIIYPKRLAWALKGARLLPYSVFFPLVSRGVASRQ